MSTLTVVVLSLGIVVTNITILLLSRRVDRLERKVRR
jgi:hypothetical protein